MQSKIIITFWISLSVFLALSLCALLYETNGLLDEILPKNTGNPPQTDLSNTRALKTHELIQTHKDRFIMEITFFFLGVTVIALIFSIKNILKSEEKKGEENLRDTGPEENFDDPEKPGRNTALADDDLTGYEFEDQLEFEQHSEVLESSYTRMLEALQKINELEKRHTIELAEANKKLETEVIEREKAEMEIRYLSRKLISGIEEAQKKLAQDLHDEFGQTLAALHMGVETLWNSMPDKLYHQKKNITHIINLIEQLGDKIRSISSDLRPDLLDDLGLVPTLEWHVRELKEKYDWLNMDFQAVGFKKRLSPECELVIYRIFQESMNNIIKHANAENVNIMLTYNYPKAILMVKDDGVGFNTKARTNGIGLLGIRERAISVDGRIEIRSEKGQGTTIRVEVPVS